MPRIFVSGSNLQWIDGGITQSIIGAIPSVMPTGFDNQSAGRIWVASDYRDDNLYYSDGGGQTRFIEGIDRGIDNTVASGRVYVNDGTCTTGTELWWSTPSGSDILIRSARSENEIASITHGVIFSVDYNNVGNTGATNYFRMTASPSVRDNLTVGGLILYVYSDSACTTVIDTLTISPTNALTLTVGGVEEVSGSIGTGYYGAGSKYWRLDTGSMYIDSYNPAVPYTFYCNGIDFVSVIPSLEGADPGVCLAVPGAATVNRCGTQCVTGPTGNSTCSDAGDGCTACSTPQGGGVGTCYNPSSSPPSPSTGQCGASCTPKTAAQICIGACSICCNGECKAKCVT